MDKAILVSIIARNGLDTAQMVFSVRVAEAKSRAADEPDSAMRGKLLAESKRLTKLIKALAAAETGLAQYLKETAGL